MRYALLGLTCAGVAAVLTWTVCTQMAMRHVLRIPFYNYPSSRYSGAQQARNTKR